MYLICPISFRRQPGAPPVQGSVLPAAVSQKLASVKVKAAASSSKPEPLLPQQVDHPSQVCVN